MQSCFPNVEILLFIYLFSDGHELHWRAFVFEAATNKECPANDDWARTPRHADINAYRERVATQD